MNHIFLLAINNMQNIPIHRFEYNFPYFAPRRFLFQINCCSKIARGMTELKTGLSLISSGQFPPVSDDIIDEIEDFLVYGLDSELSQAMPNIIYFFKSNLSTYLSTPNLSHASQHYQKRLLRAMRFIRASALNNDLSTQLEEISFIYLNTTNPSFGNSQQLAFVFLVDHFMTSPHGVHDRSYELISWAVAQIESALQHFPISNPNLYLSVLYSFPLLETISSQPNSFNHFIDSLLKISKLGLQYLKESNITSDDMSTILSKLLKLTSRLIVRTKQITQETLELVCQLDDLLSSDEIIFSQIIQNFYLVICSLIKVSSNYPNQKFIKLEEKTIKSLIRNFPYFIQMPFLHSKKIQIYIETVSAFFSRIQKTLPNLVTILPQVWNMLSCCHGHVLQVTTTRELISQLLSPELLADNPLIHHSFIENLVSSLELLRIDLKSMELSKPQARQFDIDIWLTNHIEIMKLIDNSFQADAALMQKRRIHYSSLRAGLAIRYAKYICYLLDLCGSFGPQSQQSDGSISAQIQQQLLLPDCRKRMLNLFEIAISTLTNLNQSLFKYVINRTMFDFIPKKPNMFFTKYFFTEFLKKLNHLYWFDFFTAFFTTLADRFTELTNPAPADTLLYITQTLFLEAFSNTSPLTIEQTSALAQCIYRFIIQAISSYNSSLIELLLLMFQINVQSQNRFESLAKLIRRFPSIINNALHILLEDESVKELISVLSLFLYPICQNNQVQSQRSLPNNNPIFFSNTVESWVQLFLPAIESTTMVAIPTLFRLTSNRFSQFTADLKEPTKTNFVASLFKRLSKSPKDQDLKRLLAKIPDIACRLALDRIEPKKKNTIVLINAYQFDLTIIFQAIKKINQPSQSQISTLFEGFCQYMAKLTFFDAINDKLLNDISSFIYSKSQNLFDELISRFLPPTRYVALFLHQKYRKTIGTFIIDNPTELLQHIVSLCFSRSTAVIALDIIEQFIDLVNDNDILLQINSAVLLASYYDEKKAFKIISEKILSRDYPENLSIQSQFVHYYKTALNDYRSSVRKIAIKSMMLCERYFGHNDIMSNSRHDFFLHFTKFLASQRIYIFQFLFTRPFTDVRDPLELIKASLQFLSGRTCQVFPNEILKLIKKLNSIHDMNLIYYLDTKFIIQVIAKLIPVCETLTIKEWESPIGIIQILKKDEMKQFVPKFIKTVRKEMIKLNKTVIPSLPNNIHHILSLLGQLPDQQYENILFFDLFIEFSPFLQQIQQLKQMNMQMQAISLQQLNQNMRAQIFQFVKWVASHYNTAELANISMNIPAAEQKFEALSMHIQNLKKIFKNNELDITIILQALIIFCIACKKHLIAINISYEIILTAWPTEFFNVLLRSFEYFSQKDIDEYIELYFVVLEMIENPKCQQFRYLIFDKVIQNFKPLFEKVMKNQNRELIVFRTLDSLCRIVNELDYDQFELYQVIFITRKIVNKLKKKKIDCFLTKTGDQPLFPSLFVKYIQIFLPIRFSREITENESLFNYYKTKIMTLFITRPSIQLFQHPVFNRRLIEFLKSIDEVHRNALYSLIQSPSEAQSILINQILCDKYKNFPKETRITINFSNLVKTPSFPVLILNYSAAMLATNRCVELTDLNNTPILTTNGYAQALAIDYKLRNLDSIKSLSRYSTILKVLTSIEADMPVGFENSLSQKLDTVPYILKSGLLLYRYLGQTSSMIDHTKKDFTQFIINFSTQILFASKGITDFNKVFKQNSSIVIRMMPIVFRQLMDVKSACQRMFELLLQAIIFVLTTIPEHYKILDLYPNVMNEFLNPTNNDGEIMGNESKISLQLIDTALVFQLREILADKAQVIDQSKIKFVLQLSLSIAKILFDPMITDTKLVQFPRLLLPSNYFTKNFPKDMLSLYQKTLFEMVKAGGYSVSRKIMKNMYKKYLKKVIKNISEPNKFSMFANVAKWFNDVDTPDLKKDQLIIIDYLSSLLEVFKPRDFHQLISDFSQLEQPLNRRVSNFILNLLETTFTSAISFVTKINAITPLAILQSTVALQSDELTHDCWKIDWYAISKDYHIDLFLRLVCPIEFRSLIRYLNEKEKMQVTTMTLNSIPIPANFASFMQYYIIYHPTSSLSECFSVSRRLLNSPPLPGLSLYSNISHLQNHNLTEDALGLLKDTHRNFLNACDFEMLSQFRASQFYYLKSMLNDQSNYFLGLNELRTLEINLSLHSIPHLRKKILRNKKESTYPDIQIPFFQESSSDTSQVDKLTSSVSRGHIPLLIHAAMDIEIFHYIKMMQGKLEPERLEEMIRISKTAWIPTLDRNMMMTSNFLWRLTILNDFISNSELSQDIKIVSQIKDLIKINQNLIAVLLSKSACARDALKQFSKANDPKCVTVTHQNFLRIQQYLENDSQRLVRIKSEMNMHAKNHPIPVITSPPVPAPMLGKDPGMYRSNSSMLQNDLKSKFLILMRDYTAVNVKGKKWLEILFHIFKLDSKLIDPQQAFLRILKEMQNSTIPGIPLYISMIIFMIKKTPDLIQILAKEYKTLKIDTCTLLIRWLPQLISASPNIPIDLIHSLIRTNPCYFYVTFHDYYYSLKFRLSNFGDITEKEMNFLANSNQYIKKIKSFFEPNDKSLRENKMNKEYMHIMEYLNGISFLSKCEGDIIRYNRIVKAHKLLYDALINPKIANDRLIENNFSSLNELVDFCEANQPIFTTDVKFSKYGPFIGFQFQAMKMVVNVSIESDGNTESELRLVNTKGEIKSLYLISPLLYQINQKEKVLIELIGYYIDKNISSGTRSRCTYYPSAFFIHESLMAVDSFPFTSLHSAIQPFSTVRRIFDSATNFRQNADPSRLLREEDNNSPYAVSIKKQVEIPQSALYWWFFQGSDGFKPDFVFMRSSFASCYAVYSYLHFLFSNPIPTIPSLLLCKDRRRLFMPDFLNPTLSPSRYIIQTPLLKGLLPDFVMRGSFAATWHITANSIYANKDRLQLLMSALVLEPELPSKQQMRDFCHHEQQDQQKIGLIVQSFTEQQQRLWKKINDTKYIGYMRNDRAASIHMTEETEKTDGVFPLMLLDHMIDSSQNVLMAQPLGFAWL